MYKLTFYLYSDETKDPPPSVALGPVVLSVDEIKTGIATLLIVFIPNLIIVLLFKYAGPKKDPYERSFTILEQERSRGGFSSMLDPKKDPYERSFTILEQETSRDRFDVIDDGIVSIIAVSYPTRLVIQNPITSYRT